VLLVDRKIIYGEVYHQKYLNNSLFNTRGDLVESRLYHSLKNSEKIVKDSPIIHNNNRADFAYAFSGYFSQWHTLFNRFAGFEKLEYSKGEYARTCFVGSGNEVLMDTRT
jgi:hypothetical protein